MHNNYWLARRQKQMFCWDLKQYKDNLEEYHVLGIGLIKVVRHKTTAKLQEQI